MIVKYDFKDDVDVIDQPSILTINLNEISIQHASGTETKAIPDEGNVILQIGNINSFVPIITAEEVVQQEPEGGNESENSGGDDTPTPTPVPTPDDPEPDPDPEPIPDAESNITFKDAASYASSGTANAVTFRLINNTGKTVYHSGKFKVYIKKNGSSNCWKSNGLPVDGHVELGCHFNGPTNNSGGNPHWWENIYKIAPGKYLDFVLTSFYGDVPLDKYCNKGYYFFLSNNSNCISSHGIGGISAIKLGTAVLGKDNVPTNYSGLFCVSPVNNTELQKGKMYNLVIFHANTDSYYYNRIIK